MSEALLLPVRRCEVASLMEIYDDGGCMCGNAMRDAFLAQSTEEDRNSVECYQAISLLESAAAEMCMTISFSDSLLMVGSASTTVISSYRGLQ